MAYKLIAFVVLFACSTFGQQTNTIYQQIMKDSAGGISQPVKAVGQSMHYFMARLKDSSSHVCSPAWPAVALSMTVIIQASYDNSYYFALPSTLVNTSVNGANTVSRLFIAKGAFPYINANVQLGDSVNCAVDLFYTGVLYPFNTTDVIGGSELTSGSLNVGMQYVNGTLAATGPTYVITPGNGFSVTVYGLVLCNGATAGQTITVEDTVRGITLFETPSMAIGQCVTLPPGYIPLFTTKVPSDGLKIGLSGNTKIDYSFWYRYE